MKRYLLLLTFSFTCLFINPNSINAQIFQGSTTVSATNNMNITVTVNTNTSEVEVVMTGPATQWFGYGFGGSQMNNRYSFITLGNGTVQERKLGNHSAGSVLTSTRTSTNTSVMSGVRTVTITRAITGMNSNYFTFPATATSFSIIWGKGNGTSLAQHSGSNRGSSIITLSDICNLPPTVLNTMDICMGDSALIFGKFRSAAGLYKDTLTSSAGCDSILEQTLNLKPSGTFSQPAVTICEGDSALILGQFQSVAGNYTQQLTSSFGCDSVVTQQLAVTTVDTSVTVNSNVLTANATGATYQWFDCDLNMNVAGATSNMFSPVATTGGNYAVIVTQNGCSLMSRCYFVLPVSSLTENTVEGLDLFPNPVLDILSIGVDVKWLNAEIKIMDAGGKEIYRSTVSDTEWSIDLTDKPAGVYYLQLIGNREIARRSFKKK